MANLILNVKLTDMDIFQELIDYLQEVILDDRMPGDLANEMQDKIGSIIEEARKR